MTRQNDPRPPFRDPGSDPQGPGWLELVLEFLTRLLFAGWLPTMRLLAITFGACVAGATLVVVAVWAICYLFPDTAVRATLMTAMFTAITGTTAYGVRRRQLRRGGDSAQPDLGETSDDILGSPETADDLDGQGPSAEAEEPQA